MQSAGGGISGRLPCKKLRCRPEVVSIVSFDATFRFCYDLCKLLLFHYGHFPLTTQIPTILLLLYFRYQLSVLLPVVNLHLLSQNEEAPSREFSKLSFHSVATGSACAIKPKPTTGSASQSRPPALNSSPSPLSHTRPNPIPVNNKFSSLGRRKSLTRQGKGIEKPKPKNTKEKLLNSLDHKDSSASKTSDEDAMVININPSERISDVEST
ncbi:hypothetical protein CDAR_540241 [Caerostris darwini]|uniref:Uncharacterized protein n=1 Tax=Caerostris darwini TaxID=1538125 RepID=A0AAV4WSN2_9ARAC|nr:hypothetical protein CDAR_540241 [Caerostris darwini]